MERRVFGIWLGLQSALAACDGSGLRGTGGAWTLDADLADVADADTFEAVDLPDEASDTFEVVDTEDTADAVDATDAFETVDATDAFETVDATDADEALGDSADARDTDIETDAETDTSTTWRSALYPADWTLGFADPSGARLQDYSYAGYHHGELPLGAGLGQGGVAALPHFSVTD